MFVVNHCVDHDRVEQFQYKEGALHYERSYSHPTFKWINDVHAVSLFTVTHT